MVSGTNKTRIAPEPGLSQLTDFESGPRAPAISSVPDISTLLGDLSDAIAVVTVVHHSLAAREINAVGDEEVVLRYALTLLRAAYSALDLASCREG